MTRITPIAVIFRQHREALEVRRILKADNRLVANLL